MPGLIVHVEGQTEEVFVNAILRPHLIDAGYSHVFPKIIGTGRTGGIVRWQSASKDIVNHLKESDDRVSTLMVDYFGIPADWPGIEGARSLHGAQAKAECIQNAIGQAIASQLPDRYGRRRFVPFVLMHEFEAFLFSDCNAASTGFGQPEFAAAMQAIRDEFSSPEEINDSAQTAPSKRLLQLHPRYAKVLDGNRAILEIGLPAIRAACPIFESWMTRLESIIAPTTATPLS